MGQRAWGRRGGGRLRGSQHPPPDWAAPTAGQPLQQRSGPDAPKPRGPRPGLQAGPTDRGPPSVLRHFSKNLRAVLIPPRGGLCPPPAQSSPPPCTAEWVAGGGSTSAGPSRVSRRGRPLGLGPGGPSDRQELLSPTLVHRDSANPGRPPDSQGRAPKGPEAPPPPRGGGKALGRQRGPLPLLRPRPPSPRDLPILQTPNSRTVLPKSHTGRPLCGSERTALPIPKQPFCCPEITG